MRTIHNVQADNQFIYPAKNILQFFIILQEDFRGFVSVKFVVASYGYVWDLKEDHVEFFCFRKFGKFFQITCQIIETFLEIVSEAI